MFSKAFIYCSSSNSNIFLMIYKIFYAIDKTNFFPTDDVLVSESLLF
nr:MAG TPA: hypothetical protein [Caudoviricetes sp.]